MAGLGRHAQLVLFAVIMSTGGCADVSLGESLLSDCLDTADNDGDELYNCDDPECQVFEQCRLLAPQLVLDAGNARLDGGAPPIPVFDAGNGGGASGGGPPPPPPPVSGDDAGVEPPPSCAPCGAGEECIDGQCRSVVAVSGGHFSLSITHVTLPEKDIGEACYDPCGTLPVQFVACICLPDPYVRIYREDGSGEQLIGTTSVLPERLDVSYAAESFLLDLAPGDAVRFEVWDDDEPDNDDRIYDCKPDLSDPSSTTIGCSALGSALAGLVFGIEATLTPL